MADNAISKCGRLLLKRAVSNEGSLTIKVGGKWKGAITLPKDATVATLKTFITASSKIPSDEQLLMFKGKKLLNESATLTSMKIKHNSRIFLRCTNVKAVKKPGTVIASPEAAELQNKLSTQGAGNISLSVAEQYISLAKDLPGSKSAVIKAVTLFYKSNGNVENARNHVKIQKATSTIVSGGDASSSSDTASAAMDVDELSSKKTDEIGEEAPKKKKKKKETYKDMMKNITMKRQTSDERREAHKEYLRKNLGGGQFDKLDKI